MFEYLPVFVTSFRVDSLRKAIHRQSTPEQCLYVEQRPIRWLQEMPRYSKRQYVIETLKNVWFKYMISIGAFVFNVQ